MKRFPVHFVTQLAIVLLLSAKKARVLEQPVAVNISLNEEAVFTCTAVANHINWRANSTPVSDIRDKGFYSNSLPVSINETENIYSSQLRVVGSDFSNATMIVCRVNLLAMNVYTVETSEPVVLLVQGMLNAVTELNTEILNSTTLFISWSPPYTFLLGVPILFYRVKTNSFNITVVNATNVYYPIQPSQSSIEVTVVPVNKVGDGIARTLSTSIMFITTTHPVDEDSINATMVQIQTISVKTTTTGSYTISSFATKILITPKRSPTPSGMKREGTIMIINLYVWITAAAATLVTVTVVITVVIIFCATCIILWRKKCVKFKPNDDVFMMTQENPAYATVKAMSNAIVTQKNRAYEEVTKLHKNTF